MIIAEIIKWYQPEIYELLDKIYLLDTTIKIEIEEDESPEFFYYKRIMEERRGVAL